MTTLRMFSTARQAAGRSDDHFPAATLGELLDQARVRYGETFAAVLAHSRVWVNGETYPLETALGPRDEVAILPAVAGG